MCCNPGEEPGDTRLEKCLRLLFGSAIEVSDGLQSDSNTAPCFIYEPVGAVVYLPYSLLSPIHASTAAAESPAAIKAISSDASDTAVLSELNCIFTIKEEQKTLVKTFS